MGAKPGRFAVLEARSHRLPRVPFNLCCRTSWNCFGSSVMCEDGGSTGRVVIAPAAFAFGL